MTVESFLFVDLVMLHRAPFAPVVNIYIHGVGPYAMSR